MNDSYEVVIAGGGHNSLIVGCYLAKAGVKTLIVERKDKAGGSVATRELTGPGFKQDVCSVSHALIQGNPLMRNDELELLSKYGLKYNRSEEHTSELQSLMRISYAVFCLKKKTKKTKEHITTTTQAHTPLHDDDE